MTLTLDSNDPILKKLRLGIEEANKKKPYTKYSNTKTTIDEITFDSKKESKRYSYLKLLERGKDISNLKLQVKYVLLESFIDKTGKHHREIYYVADFVYFDNKKNIEIVEDCKGFRTEIYKLKKKLLLYKYPEINFIET